MVFIIDMEKMRWTTGDGSLIKRGHLPKMVYMMGRTAFGHEGTAGKSIDVDLIGTKLLCDNCNSIVRYNKHGLAECENCGLIHYHVKNQKTLGIKLYNKKEFVKTDQYGFTSEDKAILDKIRQIN